MYYLRSFNRLCIVIATGAISVFASDPPTVMLEGSVIRADRIIAKPKESVLKTNRLKLSQAVRSVGTVRKEVGEVGGLQIIQLGKGQSVTSAIERLRASGLYEYVEPDYQVRISSLHPNDPLYLSGALWGMHNTGQSNGVEDADIDAPEGWAIRNSASNIIVAVIDTGIDYNHPDLRANMWSNPLESVNGLDDDNNGYVDDIYGINCIVTNGNPMDDHFHGTHVAGTIGAVGNNNTGVVGVAWQVKLMGIKFLNSNGVGFVSDAIAGILYAVSNGATILNNSWGGPEYSSALLNTIKWTASNGVMFVAAAGNDNVDTQEVTNYPSGYLVDNVLSVMATTREDRGAPFSNFGFDTVDIGAPGAAIWSTMPTTMTRAMSNTTRSVNYDSLSGTSMATPMVAGILALMKAHFPGEHYTNLYRRLLTNVDFLEELEDACLSEGRANLPNALTNAPGPLPNFVVYPYSQVFYQSYRFTAGDPPLAVTITNISKWTVSNRWILAGSHTSYTFHTSYVFSNIGVHEIQFDAWSANGERRTRTRKIQVDHNYRLITGIPFSWVSPTGHTPIVLGDEDFKAVPLPFPFEFYGVTYTQIFIGANGVLGFISNRMDKTAGGYPPDPTYQNAVIAVYSRDHDPSAPGGSVRYGVIGTAPDRWFVVSYTNIKSAVFSARFTFQALLSEKTGDIRINLLDLAQNNTEQGGQGAGKYAMVYVENERGWMSTEFISNNQQFSRVPDRTSIMFVRREVAIHTNTAVIEVGNTNVFLDPGETWQEYFVLKNALNTTLTGVTAVLSTPTPGVMILTPSNDFPNTAPFAMSTNISPFRYKVGNGVACGTPIEFKLTYTANGKSYEYSFWRTVGYLEPPVTNVFYAVDTPVDIRTGSWPNVGVTLSTNFVNLPGHVVRDVNMHARVTHWNIAQIDLFLRSPSMATLHVETVGTGINYGTNECHAGVIPTTWDDEAPVQMFASNWPPYIVTPYKPYQCCFSMFDGSPAHGPWVMRIESTCPNCRGTNMCWWLTIESQNSNYLCQAYAGCEDNIAPAVSNLSFTAVAGVATGLQLTAYDPDSGGLKFILASSPSYGTINSFDTNTGSFVYTAPTNYTGTDSFQFRVSDGCVTSGPATASINVLPPPQYTRRIFIADLAGTSSRVRVSDDEGVTWVNFATNLNTVRGIALSDDGEYLFVVTIGDDIVRQYRISTTTLVGQATFVDQTAFNRRPVATFRDGPVHRVYVSSEGSTNSITFRMQGFTATASGMTTNFMLGENWQAGYLAVAVHGGVTYLLAPGHGANASVRRWMINPDGSLGGFGDTLGFFAPGGTNKLDPRGIFPISNGAIIPSAHSNQPNGFYVVPMYQPAGNYTAGVVRVYDFGAVGNSASDPGEWFFDVSRTRRHVYGISRGGSVDYLYRWEFEPLTTNFTFLGSVQLDGTGGKGFSDAYSIAVLEIEQYSAPTLTPYQIWAQQNITNGQTNELQDADNDGILNWEEWVTDSNPMASNAPFAVQSIAVGTNAWVFFPSSTGRLYTLQWTDNLPAHWWSNVAGQVDKFGSGTITNLIDLPATNAFFRVRVRVP
ncbi:MAG: S8 family serine peptidase [Kiritimatiellae bacterium]|nr:S8 family serine peptidase [Kiritimatiellia bacterium]MDW8458316.1 S8 family serine peptidase [Verrucomicrobiota bacterium]